MGSNPCRIIPLLGIAHPVEGKLFQVQGVFRDIRNLHVFLGNEGSTGYMTHFEWLKVCHVPGVE